MIYSFQRLRKLVQEGVFPLSTLDGSEDQDHASEEINQKYLMTAVAPHRGRQHCTATSP